MRHPQRPQPGRPPRPPEIGGALLTPAAFLLPHVRPSDCPASLPRSCFLLFCNPPMPRQVVYLQARGGKTITGGTTLAYLFLAYKDKTGQVLAHLALLEF